MKEFVELLEVAEKLHDPKEGCPWDLKQTFQTLRSYILEEAHEALEAIDSDDVQHMIEELGDLLYTVIFCAMIAKRENRFSLKDILQVLKEKLIRRHPHIFGEKKNASMEQIIQKWEEIKKEEKKNRKPENRLPKTLPSLQKASKIIAQSQKKGFTFPEMGLLSTEEKFAARVYCVVEEAIRDGIDIESAFRAFLAQREKVFFSWLLNSSQP